VLPWEPPLALGGRWLDRVSVVGQTPLHACRDEGNLTSDMMAVGHHDHRLPRHQLIISTAWTGPSCLHTRGAGDPT